MAHKEELSLIDIGTVPDDTELASFILEKIKKLGNYINLLVFKHHEVQIGVIRQGTMKLERQEELAPEWLKELRAFSPKGELYIWSQGGKLKYRLRIDEDKENNDTCLTYTEEHLMWGDQMQGAVISEKNRGMKYTMPFPAVALKRPLKYKVKNYYKFDDLGLVQFQDARLMQFLNADGIALQ